MRGIKEYSTRLQFNRITEIDELEFDAFDHESETS